MHCKQTSRKDGCSSWESSEYYLQGKQCLCLSLMENQESDPTKRSNQPSWVILEGSGHLAKTAEYFLPERHFGSSLLAFQGRDSRRVLRTWFSFTDHIPLSSQLLEVIWSYYTFSSSDPWGTFLLSVLPDLSIHVNILIFRYCVCLFVCVCVLKRDVLLRKFKDKEGFTICYYWTRFSVRKRLFELKGSSRWPEWAFAASLKERVYCIPVI